MPNKQAKKGFTLIEIVIVLAIAALIMVVVFFAVQGAQRGQRDQARKDATNRLLSAITAYRGNNNGGTPSGATDLAAYIPQNERKVGAANITLAANSDKGSSAWTSGTACATYKVDNTTINISYDSTTNKDYAAICLESTGTAYVVY